MTDRTQPESQPATTAEEEMVLMVKVTQDRVLRLLSDILVERVIDEADVLAGVRPFIDAVHADGCDCSPVPRAVVEAFGSARRAVNQLREDRLRRRRPLASRWPEAEMESVRDLEALRVLWRRRLRRIGKSPKPSMMASRPRRSKMKEWTSMRTFDRRRSSTTGGVTYELERSVDPACRHYTIEGIRAENGVAAPFFFDVYVGDYNAGHGRIPSIFFVRLEPSAHPFPIGTYDLGWDGVHDDEVIGEAVDKYLSEHAHLFCDSPAIKRHRGRS